MNGFEVLQAGPQTLLQDAGRLHWQHLGVSPCGPVDPHAAAWANRLLGNRWGSALLEVALGDLTLHSGLDTWVAVCGAEVSIRMNGEPRPNWSRFAVPAGAQLQLGFARSGQRAYLAVVGGFSATPQLGSVATQQREGIGGPHGDGSALRAGDLLGCAVAQLPWPASVPWPFIKDYRQVPSLRVITGGAASGVEPDQLKDFFARPWRVSPHSDRMGTRLQGMPLTVSSALPWSRGVSNGAIQLPPDGLPIILLADRPSMGGYPLLGWLHPLDLGRLAQCPAHQALQFSEVSLADSQADLLMFYRFFR